MPVAQQNKVSAYTLLALAGLKPEDDWSATTGNSMRVAKDIRRFIREVFGVDFKDRETIRRQALHYFVQAGLVAYNPDNPNLPVNSPNAHYALTAEAVALLQTFGAPSSS